MINIFFKVPKSKHIHPFHYIDRQSHVEAIAKLNDTAFQAFQLNLFMVMTGIDPRIQKIKAIVVFNAGEMLHIIRMVYQHYGPFPLIGCDRYVFLFFL
jgi:hypothetical protein